MKHWPHIVATLCHGLVLVTFIAALWVVVGCGLCVVRGRGSQSFWLARRHVCGVLCVCVFSLFLLGYVRCLSFAVCVGFIGFVLSDRACPFWCLC
jgi:hypothetical protein